MTKREEITLKPGDHDFTLIYKSIYYLDNRVRVADGASVSGVQVGDSLGTGLHLQIRNYTYQESRKKTLDKENKITQIVNVYTSFL